jgi:hypothetical protein
MWNAAVKLGDISVSSAVPCGEGPDQPSVLTRPPNASALYLPSFATDQQLMRVHACEVRVRAMEKVADGVYELDVWLQPKGELAAGIFTDKDVFHITISGAPFRGRVSFFAGRPVREQRNALKLTSMPTALSKADAGILSRSLDRPIRTASFRCYPLYDVPCDVYAMGMVLLGTLLGGREQDVNMIRERVIEPVGRELQLKRYRDANVTPEELSAIVLDLLRANEYARPHHVLYRQEPDGEVSLPGELWYEAVALGLRLATDIPGFSWCQDRSDFPAEEPARLVARIRERVTELAQQAHALLFGAAGAEAELAEVVAAILRELGEGDALPEGDPQVVAAAEALRETVARLTGELEGKSRDEVARTLEEGLRAALGDQAPEAARTALDSLRGTKRVRLPRDEEVEERLRKLKDANDRLAAQLAEAQQELEDKDRALSPAVRDFLLGPEDRRDRINPAGYDQQVDELLSSAGAAVRAGGSLAPLGDFASRLSTNVQTLLREFGIGESIVLFHHAALEVLERGGTLGEYLEALRTAVKIFTREPIMVIRKWCTERQEDLRPERFMAQEGFMAAQRKAKAWDNYCEYYRTINFEEHLLPLIKRHIVEEWERIRRALQKPG